nr:unnamed protein product [Callosobruchus analis]
MQIPAMESHYSRERSQRKYFGSHLNLSRLYRLYRDYCEEKNIPEQHIAKEWLYTEVFNKEFNISFKYPSNDTCDLCDSYLIRLKDESNAEEKRNLQCEYEDHLAEASKRYQIKKTDKEECAKYSASKIMLTVDLQKCLPTPLLTNSQSFYSLKLWTYNYTLYDSTNKITTCVMWDESKASRGANEMASGMLHWAQNNIQPHHREIIVWSDNCPSQNRNFIMVMAYVWILRQFPFLEVINHKYLLRGHTHLEVDACHALIERERKKAVGFQIMTPWDWQQLARMSSANNPFSIINMHSEDFVNCKTLYNSTTSPFMTRKKNEAGEDVCISKMIHIQIRQKEPDILFYKYDFSESEFHRVSLMRTGRRVQQVNELPQLFPEGTHPISSKKYQHLQKLLPWIPKEFHTFYKNLRKNSERQESDCIQKILSEHQQEKDREQRTGTHLERIKNQELQKRRYNARRSKASEY